MTPSPPACAMAMAMRASVTVSMAAATIGMFREIVRVMRDRSSVSDGNTSDRAGRNNTSSKVKASRRLPLGSAAIYQLSSLTLGPHQGEAVALGGSIAGRATRDPLTELALVDSTAVATMQSLRRRP